MKTLNLISALMATTLAAAFIADDAAADCAAASVDEVKADFTKAQALDAQGKKAAALYLYEKAQEPTCDVNPYELDAAKRAAELALPLGAAAEQQGKFDVAFQFYEAGGHFAKADAMLMAQLRTQPDNPKAFENARSHFDTRSLPSFQSNNAVRIKIAGAYRIPSSYMAEVLAMPPKGIERALAQESAQFDERYLRESVEVLQSRPDQPTDSDGLKKTIALQSAFSQRWPEDLLKKSRATLTVLRDWGSATDDPELARSAQKHFFDRIEGHVAILTQKYSGSPELLDQAIDYTQLLNLEPRIGEPRIAKIRSQALKLGDDAAASRRYSLAASYYEVAGDRAKAQAVRDQQRNEAMAKMQPTIDQLQRQADAMRAQYSDPKQIQAMREQAAAMQQALRQQQAGRDGKKSADQLAKDLGL